MSKLATSATVSITGSTSAGATFTVALEKAPRWFPNKMSNREAADFWRQHIEYHCKALLGKWIPDSIRECLEPVILIMIANFCSPKFLQRLRLQTLPMQECMSSCRRALNPPARSRTGGRGASRRWSETHSSTRTAWITTSRG
jgi:hypothetical protein